jgi:hypothetical protein
LSVRIWKQDCDPADAQDRKLPVNAYLVAYENGERLCYDVTICGKQSDMFDHYWDRYRDGLKGWKQAEGRVPTRTWMSQQEMNHKPKQTKKR